MGSTGTRRTGREVIPIGSITINPMANNRRAVILQGKTKTVNAYQGQDSFGERSVAKGLFWKMTQDRLTSSTWSGVKRMRLPR